MEMSVALARLFRVPVELHVGQTFEESALADGPKATALEAGQLVPGVLGVSGSILRRARLNLSARDFIHGRFGRPR